jgi:hypothetical protein
MRPIDRFFCHLDKLAFSLKPGENLNRQIPSSLCSEFSSLLSPVIGREGAEDLFYRTTGRGDRLLQKLGAMAAFLLGEFADTQSLDEEDFENIRQILEEVSGEINLNTLTALMGELLARGRL